MLSGHQCGKFTLNMLKPEGFRKTKTKHRTTSELRNTKPQLASIFANRKHTRINFAEMRAAGNNESQHNFITTIFQNKPAHIRNPSRTRLREYRRCCTDNEMQDSPTTELFNPHMKIPNPTTSEISDLNSLRMLGTSQGSDIRGFSEHRVRTISDLQDPLRLRSITPGEHREHGHHFLLNKIRGDSRRLRSGPDAKPWRRAHAS